jgi:LPXTG-motif cell wall-anchored protein
MRILRKAALAAGAAGMLTLAIGFGGTSANADPAAPNVTPNPVAAGAEITVSGSDCTGEQLVGVEIEVLDADDSDVADGGVDPGDISDGGDWSTEVEIPSDTPAGDYTVASTCDDYLDGFDYPDTALEVDAAPATASAHLSASTVHAGGTITVTGSGFIDGENVSITLHSTPVTLATVVADASGDISKSVNIPSDTPLGVHSIVLLGGTSGATATASLTVSAASSGTTDGTSGTSTTTGTSGTSTTTGGDATGSTLPKTGSTNNSFLEYGSLMVVIGAAAVFFTRRVHRGSHRREGFVSIW